MQSINAAYAVASDRATRTEQPNWTESQYTHAQTVAEGIRQAIERILTLKGLEIEVCGTWVWVGGKTKMNKVRLMRSGYKYASKKQMWYYPGTPARNKGKTWSMGQIRDHYGSRKVTSNEKGEAVYA